MLKYCSFGKGGELANFPKFYYVYFKISKGYTQSPFLDPNEMQGSGEITQVMTSGSCSGLQMSCAIDGDRPNYVSVYVILEVWIEDFSPFYI